MPARVTLTFTFTSQDSPTRDDLDSLAYAMSVQSEDIPSLVPVSHTVTVSEV